MGDRGLSIDLYAGLHHCYLEKAVDITRCIWLLERKSELSLGSKSVLYNWIAVVACKSSINGIFQQRSANKDTDTQHEMGKHIQIRRMRH